MKMKRSSMIALVLALVFVLGFYGVAFSGGGEPTKSCPQDMPDPTSGPFLFGAFTVALDKSYCGVINADVCSHYTIQLTLARFGKSSQLHLFSFSTPSPVTNTSICSLSNSDIKDAYKRMPCLLNVGQAFGLEGTPVIADLHITKKDFCTIGPGNPSLTDLSNMTGFDKVPINAMISGEVVVRVVP